MHRTLAILTSLALVVAAAGSMGCSSTSSPTSPVQGGDGGDGSTGHTDSDGCDPTMAASFKTDVIPVFASCTLTSSCHGQTGNQGEENLFLGDSTTSSSDVRSLIVGVKSIENPSMDFVTGGDLENSFLWHKVKGDMNSDKAVAAGCSMATCSDCMPDTPCGGLMPYLNNQLDTPRLCAIKNWIAQGAADN